MLLLWPQTVGTGSDKTLTYLHESIINTKHSQKDMHLIKSPARLHRVALAWLPHSGNQNSAVIIR